MNLLNKTMDRDDLDLLECKAIIRELEDLMRFFAKFRLRKIKYSSWYGSLGKKYIPLAEQNKGSKYQPYPNAYDDKKIPWYLYWEIAWSFIHSGVKHGEVVLDAGGSSSLFSFYLASKGCKVYTVDLNSALVKNSNYVGKRMGWPIQSSEQNMKDLNYSDNFFDHIFSICVMEHLEREDRIQSMKQFERVLSPGGRISLTFDYLNPDPSMTINSPKDVYDQFVSPTKLQIVGNPEFIDNGKRYLREIYRPERGLEYTFGSLFLIK